MYTNTTQKIRGSTLYKKESQDDKENHNNNDMEIISVNTVRKIGIKITQILIIQCTIYYIDGKLKEFQLIQEISYSLTKQTNKLNDIIISIQKLVLIKPVYM